MDRQVAIRVLIAVLLAFSVAGGSLASLVTASAQTGEEPVVGPGGGPEPGSGPINVTWFVRGIDGDTLETWIAGSRVGIGIIGIEAPEGNTVCGAAAADYLQSLVFAGMHLEEDDEIVYDERLRRMFYVSTLDGLSIAADLVRAGVVRATGEGRDADVLLALEAEARDAGRGCLWDGSDSETTIAGAADSGSQSTPGPSREMLALPTGFREEVVVSGLDFPTDFAFLPDGRILVAEKDGVVRLFKNGQLLATPFIDISSQVNDYWDRGLLSVAVDPSFSSNGYVYLLFTYEDNPSNYSGAKTGRLIRVTAGGDTASLSTQVTILGSVVGSSCNNFPTTADCIPSDSPSHSTGGMRFAGDGSLFVTLGDGASFMAATEDALRAQDLDSLGGKLLRITASGEGLSGNPFWNGDPDANRSKVWASGFRNAYRFGLRPDSGMPYVGDVGWASWEEINVVPAGSNMGWPCYEGESRQSAYSGESACQQLYNAGTASPPLVTWDHSQGSSAATGGVFYTGTQYPALYQGAYFYGDYAQGFIDYIHVDDSDQLVSGPDELTGNSGGPVDFEMGADGYLYYLAINNGEVRRFVYDAPPTSDGVYISDLPWVAEANGWGPAERDRSNGEQGAADGGPITIDGVSYPKGVGAHAASEIVIVLDGTCSTFSAVAGVDDETGSSGSVDFEVWGDSELLASARNQTGSGSGVAIAADISGQSQVRLVVTDAGDGNGWDHADWGDAKLACGSDETPPEVTSREPVDGATGVPVNASVTATFSETIDEATLAGNVVLTGQGGPAVDATLSYDAGTSEITLIPDSHLETSTTYVMTISGGPGGVADLAGNPLAADEVWSFTTASTGGPTPTITSPLATDTFTVGDTIDYSGFATDSQGNVLPDSALSWRIIIHHCSPVNCHTHQVLEESGIAGGSFVVPDHGDDFYFEFILEATDDSGLTGETSVEVFPETVAITLDTQPAGLTVSLGGFEDTAPLTREVVVGSMTTIAAPSPQGNLVFDSWSDGGEQIHQVLAGDSDLTLTATFVESDPDTAQYLSDLPWDSATNGWGPVERDRSNGEQGAGDGGPITIDGVSYPTGLGAHADSEISYTIASTCTGFSAVIGIDDETGSNGSVIFEVWADDVRIYQSATLTGSGVGVPVDLTLTGQTELRLVVTGAGDGNGWDHADWADARIFCDEPPPDTTPPSVTSVSPLDGATGVPVSTSVAASFSEPIDEATLADNFTLLEQGGPAASATLSYDSGSRTVTLRPAVILAPDTTYVVTISGGPGGVTDLAGNPLAADEVWSFTTEAGGGSVYISDLPWVAEANGWGPAERDRSNGEQGAADGGPITIDGVSYPKGVGVHAASEIVLALDGTCSTFSAVAGVDDETGSSGTVHFEVWSGSDRLYQSPMATGAGAGIPVSVDVSGLTELSLVVTDAGDGNGWDHADWADATLACGEEPPAPDTVAPTITGTSPGDGENAVAVDVTITASFSESIDEATLAGNVELATQSGTTVAIRTSYDEASQRLTITPSAALDPETVYVVTITGGSGGVADLAGNPLAADEVWSFTTGTGSSGETGLLAPPVKFPTGTHAHGVTHADLNGDGDPDLLVANADDHAVSVLIGDGNGGFSVPENYPTGVHPKFVAAGDFNRDGIPDFASANQDDVSGNDVSVYLGNGDGTFESAGFHGTCSHPHEVAAGDLDGDGDDDLALACSGGSELSVLISNGDGTFGTAVDYGVGTTPLSAVIADYDGDGNLDIAVADYGSATLSILPGNGDGTFQPRISQPAGSGPHSIRSGDLNRDGIADLAIANEFDDSVSVLLGNGDATFSRQDIATGDDPKGIAIGDLNGDGWLDIVSTNVHGTYPCCEGETSITLLLNDGSGDFVVREDHVVTSTPFSATIADFDNDGRNDVVTANWHTNDVALFRGTG